MHTPSEFSFFGEGRTRWWWPGSFSFRYIDDDDDDDPYSTSYLPIFTRFLFDDNRWIDDDDDDDDDVRPFCTICLHLYPGLLPTDELMMMMMLLVVVMMFFLFFPLSVFSLHDIFSFSLGSFSTRCNDDDDESGHTRVRAQITAGPNISEAVMRLRFCTTFIFHSESNLFWKS